MPDYLDKISHPMDYSTMSEKIDSHAYPTMHEFEADFQLIIKNCLTYNEPGSYFYKLGVKMQADVSPYCCFFSVESNRFIQVVLLANFYLKSH